MDAFENQRKGPAVASQQAGDSSTGPATSTPARGGSALLIDTYPALRNEAVQAVGSEHKLNELLEYLQTLDPHTRRMIEFDINDPRFLARGFHYLKLRYEAQHELKERKQ